MKKLKSLIILFLLIGFSQHSEAQFFKKLGEHAKKKIEQEAENRSERRVDKAIDKGFDETEETIDGKNKKKNKKSKKSKKSQKASQDQSVQETTKSKDKAKTKKAKPTVVWSKFDFIPGDTVIFEDMPSAEEENGEFPSRWDLVKGQVEIAEVDGEQIMMFIDGSPAIVPYLKNNKEDYLPEVFTIEFDFYKPKEGNRISVYLYDTKNQEQLTYPDYTNMYMDIDGGEISEKLDDIQGIDPKMNYQTKLEARWIHISIAYTKGKLKVYMDDTRVINIPHYTGNPSGLTLQAYWADLGEDKAYYFKNIRIAKGGVKYYDRVLSEGKIIVNGIKFDINKATLKPESMGPINKIYKMMVKKPTLNFSVEGHTDADGGDASNMELSKKRAKTVMNKLIAMGIDKSRLKSTGYGESKPIDNNNTPEGKANNRRVEFVKF
jgi:outer membrane protein OmpA-like peptidoglycan-associated protein